MSQTLPKSDYELGSDGAFFIRQYNQKKPFSNFLPGVAGLYGTPMWVFYVNRSQGIASFGTRNKDQAILEFFPANKAYQNTPLLGFRTFLKINRPGQAPMFYEPFQERMLSHPPKQSMEICSHELRVVESHPALGLEFAVRYFTVPSEPIAALSRTLTITNISSHAMEIEVLDGLPQLCPFGMNEFFVKNMSRTIEAWMMVEGVPEHLPFYKLRVDATDRPEVEMIDGGNFFFSLQGSKLLPAVVDPALVFGSMLDFREPKEFILNPTFGKSLNQQVAENKTPCAFSLAHLSLEAGKAKVIQSYFGQADSPAAYHAFSKRAISSGFYAQKAQENQILVDGIKSNIFCATSSQIFDLYTGQTYLDNVLRGGMPVVLGEKEKELVLYVYSRKHGDLERDYNRFLVEPAYFAQGDGNYRDVNQNRRVDTFFEPRVKDLNIKTFLNLIQLDGFNPLVTKGTTFRFKTSADSKRALNKWVPKKSQSALEKCFSGSFTLGELCRMLDTTGALPKARFEVFLKDIVGSLVMEMRAEHGEGFWVDHWTYNLDLIESYLGVFPEELKNLLFTRKDFTFYDDDHCVRPRSEKYFLKKSGEVRQYKAVMRVAEKTELIASRPHDKNAVRTQKGKGQIYQTTLIVKLLSLVLNKVASLDPFGRGIEMEADKPSWYDALNGLPGLLGSSLCETFELKRLVLFLVGVMEHHKRDSKENVAMPEEIYEFYSRMGQLLDRHLRRGHGKDTQSFWDEASRIKEEYRQKVFFGLSGKERGVALGDLKVFLEHVREKVEIGIDGSLDKSTGMYPTYFENEVTKFKKLKSGENVWPLEFKQKTLPTFLEGPVHAMKVERDSEKRKRLFLAVRQSKLYDTKLGMYRVNTSLKDASYEIGRCRVFKPGWLENESIWLHMEYKWLLELLKNGMTEEFYTDFRKALVAFQQPSRYGRSVFENSSFIVSSSFSDSNFHGTGFVARLSGSTAEFCSMWLFMMAGRKPFYVGPEGKLSLRFQPSIPQDFFLKEAEERVYYDKKLIPHKIKLPKDSLAFLFLGRVLVVYHNPRGLDTFGKMRVHVKKVTLTDHKHQTHSFKGDTIPSPFAEKVRSGFIERIDIEMG